MSIKIKRVFNNGDWSVYSDAEGRVLFSTKMDDVSPLEREGNEDSKEKFLNFFEEAFYGLEEEKAAASTEVKLKAVAQVLDVIYQQMEANTKEDTLVLKADVRFTEENLYIENYTSCNYYPVVEAQVENKTATFKKNEQELTII